MATLSFDKVAATLFGIVAFGHAARLAMALPVQIGATQIPLSASWLGLALSAALCVWGFRSGSARR